MTLKENRERFIEREGLKVCSNFTVENFNCFNCIENGTWEYCNNYKKREKVAPQGQSEDKAKALQEMKNYDNLVEEEERLRNRTGWSLRVSLLPEKPGAVCRNIRLQTKW